MAVCDIEIDLDCSNCYEVSRASSSLNFLVGLTPSTAYYLFVEDKFDNIYRVLITSGADGSITIDPASFPGSLFNKFAGVFTVVVSTSLTAETTSTLTIGGTAYSCISLSITDVGVNCETPEPPNGLTVIILNQDGVVVTEVECGGTYPVLQFSGIDGGNSTTLYNNSIVAIP